VEVNSAFVFIIMKYLLCVCSLLETKILYKQQSAVVTGTKLCVVEWDEN